MRPFVVLTVTALAATACATGDEVGADAEEPVGTATPTPTRSPTAASVSPSPTSPAPETVTVDQDIILAPQEPVEVSTGEPQRFSVLGDDLPPALDVALFPCEDVSFGGAGATFLVEDGAAVGIGDTDTGSARIVTVNGDAVEPTTSVEAVDTTNEPGSADPALALEVAADAPDCAVPVVFDDADDDGELDVRDERLSGAKVTITG